MLEVLLTMALFIGKERRINQEPLALLEGRDRKVSDCSEATIMPTAREIIAALDLKPHPIEGGHFRETYRSTGMIPGDSLPGGYVACAGRSMGTAIYYLLTAETFSEMHRVPTEEVFHLYLGGPARMLQLFPGG